MRGPRLALIAASGLLTTACATPDPVAFAKGTAEFLVIAASQDEYVEACTVRGNSSLECQADYGDTRAGHQAYYRAQKQEREQQSIEALTVDLDAYLETVEQGSGPD